MKFIPLLLFFYCSLLVACSNRSENNSKTVAPAEQQQRTRRKVQVNIVSPKNNEKFTLGSQVNLSVKVQESAGTVDSLLWFVDGALFRKASADETVTWNSSGYSTGTHRVETVVYYSSGQRDIVSVNIILLADKAPVRYTYKVIQTYPHDRKAYTQGLLFAGGFLYESTGLREESTLRKVILETGEPVQVKNMPPEMFGEGLALVDDKFIQLTWQEQVAFVYRKNDFELLQRINYPMKEGWGLTYDGTHLIMSDGSATLYFLDKEYLTEIRRLEVCDHSDLMKNLNELEYINGEVWANVYGKYEILRIDPATGVVLGYIDNLNHLLNPEDWHSSIDVLNGIAYDEEGDRIFITGKNWPKLFQIELVKR